MGDLPGDTTISLNYSREANEVSKATIIVSANDPVLEWLTPWLHWITVWDCGIPSWDGVVQKVTIGARQATIEAKDLSTFMWRTRTPLSRNFSQLDPASIAETLWNSMLELHRIDVTPLVFTELQGRTFDFAVQADVRMLDQTMDDLVKIGLDWTVMAGKPVLGSLPEGDPIAALSDSDFLVDMEVVRDGTFTANDVRLQGANYAETARVDMGDLHLQALVSMDDMYGVSNVARATAEYAKHVARVPTMLVIPSGASLHPDAPWELREMVPGAVVSVYGREVLSHMRLQQLEVHESAGSHEIKVTLESLRQTVELSEAAGTETLKLSEVIPS